MAKKTWSEKMASPCTAEVQVLDKPMMKVPAGAKMLISTPGDIAAMIQTIPAGQVWTTTELREALAKSAGADVTCPLTTGIFLRIVTEYTHERAMTGTPMSELAPVWRAVGPKSSLRPKLSFDPVWLDEALRREQNS